MRRPSFSFSIYSLFHPPILFLPPSCLVCHALLFFVSLSLYPLYLIKCDVLRFLFSISTPCILSFYFFPLFLFQHSNSTRLIVHLPLFLSPSLSLSLSPWHLSLFSSLPPVLFLLPFCQLLLLIYVLPFSLLHYQTILALFFLSIKYLSFSIYYCYSFFLPFLTSLSLSFKFFLTLLSNVPCSFFPLQNKTSHSLISRSSLSEFFFFLLLLTSTLPIFFSTSFSSPACFPSLLPYFI
ncbi:unnamed protein product [Acanthosepion pharaonis]|uniref:Uncharacterized protein n=1 Tax=Acanthosepion pharaonis TaxID=158019 RepID=A0A812AM54_ACAPH|nr:unnamed protein product [Sepia pharaonis]